MVDINLHSWQMEDSRKISETKPKVKHISSRAKCILPDSVIQLSVAFSLMARGNTFVLGSEKKNRLLPLNRVNKSI